MMKDKLIEEAMLMVQLRNPFLVKVYGICDSKLIMELMPLGSLYKLIESKVKIQFYEIRLQIMIDVIKGLEYLHSKNIIHGDIKSLNILLCEEGGSIKAKISDFGLSKLYTTSPSSNSTLSPSSMNDHIPNINDGLSLKWAAPELLQNLQPITPSIDIYAFGMVVQELIALKKPYEGLSSDTIIRKVISGEREIIPVHTPPILSSIINQCWTEFPESRPKPIVICDELIQLQELLVDKSNPYSLGNNSNGMKTNHQSTDFSSGDYYHQNNHQNQNQNNDQYQNQNYIYNDYDNDNNNNNNSNGTQYRQQHNTFELI